jgi:hypothetical protein
MTAQAALEAYLGESLLQMTDPQADQTPVRLKLSLTRPTQTDTTPLPFEMSPPSDEAGRQVSKLSQFDLQLTFMALRPQSKNVQNQSCPINDPALRELLEIAFLNRRDRLINDHKVRALCRYPVRDLLRLPSAHKSPCLRDSPCSADTSNDHRTCRLSETAEFLEV